MKKYENFYFLDNYIWEMTPSISNTFLKSSDEGFHDSVLCIAYLMEFFYSLLDSLLQFVL